MFGEIFMLFNSYEYIFFFLPITFFIYFFLLNRRLIVGAKGFLVFASLFFYSWWNIAYLPLILSSMLFNYLVGNSLNDNFSKIKIHKKTLLLFGVTANLALLGYFKYADFFIENFNLAFDGSLGMLHLALPLAISFFTFQQIAYLADSYRGETAEYDFLNYALFVTFFPQLIAGPIVHHKEMMPQFASTWNLVKHYKNIATGLFIFSIGLFKKVVIADTFAQWATAGFDNAAVLNLFEAWATSLSYTFQLYFDFSGYTDMAIGAALLFNIKLPINFNSPYKAKNVIEFWSRWHMTLTRFLTTYIYEPIVKSFGRFSFNRAMFATFTTMLLAGLWHGAAWSFVLFGALHGMAIVINHLWKRRGKKLPKWLAWFLTFNFINFSLVIFRAKEWDDATKVFSGMTGINGVLTSTQLDHIAAHFHDKGRIAFDTIFMHINGSSETVQYLIAGFLLIALKNSNYYLETFKCTKKTLLVFIFLTTYGILSLNKISEFLYFNF